MTNLQRISLRMSEVRERLNKISGLSGDNFTEEIRSESEKLSTEYQDLEARHRAAIVGESETETLKPADSETRELSKLIERVNLGSILQASLYQTLPDGREKEVQDHFGLATNQFPIEALKQVRAEVRAVTPAPSDVGRVQHGIIPQIFPDSVTGFLGVGQPTVGVGQQTYTVLTTGATVHTPAKGASAAESTGEFTAHNLSPKRAQASFFWNIEDQSSLSGLDSALRQNLGLALPSKLDNIVLNDSTAGLLGGGLTQPDAPGAVETYASYKSAVTGRVDGLYASTPNGVRVLIGAETYRHSESIYRGSTTDNQSGYEVMMSKTNGGVRVSSLVPAAASNIQAAIVSRSTAIHAVMPIWRAVTFLPDSITKAETGQIKLTAVLLYGLAVVRSAGFAPLKFKLA